MAITAIAPPIPRMSEPTTIIGSHRNCGSYWWRF
jgi:hypothetical protein